ncbi:MAG TPA: hypothetical protein VG797_06980 [Phycisphaerales bacterium]|nr:hypothetical protein [Phycisphaerales bacterium]
MRKMLRLTAMIVLAPMALLAACAPTHFVLPGTRQSINDLRCDGGTSTFNYTANRDDKSIYLDLNNTGSCPMLVVRTAGGNETDRFTVPGEKHAYIRLKQRGDFTLTVSCPANAVGSSCGGSLRFVAERKGAADGTAGSAAEWIILEGDQVSEPMPCDAPSRELPIHLINRDSNPLPLQGEVDNTGGCLEFNLDVRAAGMQSRHDDGRGGNPSTFNLNIPPDKDCTFYVSCSGPHASNCDGRVRLTIPAQAR